MSLAMTSYFELEKGQRSGHQFSPIFFSKVAHMVILYFQAKLFIGVMIGLGAMIFFFFFEGGGEIPIKFQEKKRQGS